MPTITELAINQNINTALKLSNTPESQFTTEFYT